MVHGKYSIHPLPACSVAWAQLALEGFAWTAGQRQGLLSPIHPVEPQDPGPGTPDPGSRVPRLGHRAFSVGGVDPFRLGQ